MEWKVGLNSWLNRSFVHYADTVLKWTNWWMRWRVKKNCYWLMNRPWLTKTPSWQTSLMPFKNRLAACLMLTFLSCNRPSGSSRPLLPNRDSKLIAKTANTRANSKQTILLSTTFTFYFRWIVWNLLHFHMYFTERKKWADEGIHSVENKTLRCKERG